MRKTGWLIAGLIAPELIVYSAWYQRRASRKLGTVVHRVFRQQKTRSWFQRLGTVLSRWVYQIKPNDCKPRDAELQDNGNHRSGRHYEWTAIHSFYAIMGGFVFDTLTTQEKFLPGHRQRLTLTPKGILYILEHEPSLLPDISKKHIWDKSKASGLVKMLVCLQAIWVCTQCIVRIAQRLAVSLLELNVFGHAICALLIYFFWWDKPLDIEEPTLLTGEMANEMCALMCMRSSEKENGGPELPNGIRYGDNWTSSIVETSMTTIVKPKRNELILLGILTVLVRISIPVIGPVITALMFLKEALYLFIKWLQNRQDDPPAGTIPYQSCRLAWSSDSVINNANNVPSSSVQPSEEIGGATVGQEAIMGHEALIACPAELLYPDPAYKTGKDLYGIEPVSFKPTGDNLLNAAAFMELSSEMPVIRSGPQEAYVNTQYVEGFHLILGGWHKERFTPRTPQPDYSPDFVNLSHADIERWRLCARALQRYCPQPEWVMESGVRSHQNFPAEDTVCDYLPNWPTAPVLSIDGKVRVRDNYILIGISVATLLYGGLHLLAWNAPFLSERDQGLWNVSGTVLASSGIIIAMLYLTEIKPRRILRRLYANLDRGRRSLGVRTWYFIVHYALAFVILSVLTLYAAARSFLVIECFIQVTQLPHSAYTLPDWSKYFPHIT